MQFHIYVNNQTMEDKIKPIELYVGLMAAILIAGRNTEKYLHHDMIRIVLLM